MTLIRVEYEFVEFEEPSNTAFELARQIRLDFSDAPTVYVSWNWKRQRGQSGEPYSITYAESSHFSEGAAQVGDKLVRITLDPSGQRIISAGYVQARNIANSIASGRFIPQ